MIEFIFFAAMLLSSSGQLPIIRPLSSSDSKTDHSLSNGILKTSNGSCSRNRLKPSSNFPGSRRLRVNPQLASGSRSFDDRSTTDHGCVPMSIASRYKSVSCSVQPLSAMTAAVVSCELASQENQSLTDINDRLKDINRYTVIYRNKM